MWEGMGRAGPGRGSPTGNLQRCACFVIPWTIFHPLSRVFLQAGDNGAGLRPSCDSDCPLRPAPGEGNLVAGKGLTFGPMSHAVPASPGRREIPSKGSAPEGPPGPHRHLPQGHCTMLVAAVVVGALPGVLLPGMGPSLGMTWATRGLIHIDLWVSLSLQRSIRDLCTLTGKFWMLVLCCGTRGWVVAKGLVWEARREPGGSCAFLGPFQVKSATLISAISALPIRHAAVTPSCQHPARLSYIIPPLRRMGTHLARASTLLKPAALCNFGEETGEFLHRHLLLSVACL